MPMLGQRKRAHRTDHAGLGHEPGRRRRLARNKRLFDATYHLGPVCPQRVAGGRR